MKMLTAIREYAYGQQRVIPSLDGIRGVSILLVLLAHLSGTEGFLDCSGMRHLGTFGVRIFFVISGYLITSILLKELYRTHSINLGRFYFRRTLRLFPACYFYIVVIALLASQNIVALMPYDLISAASYTINYYDNRSWYLGHLWSLAIEEQFYLLWPATLRVLGTRTSAKLLAVMVIAGPFVRLASPYLGPCTRFLVFSDTLAIGCLLAVFRDTLWNRQLYRRVLDSGWFFLVPVLAISANYIPSTKVTWLVGETVMNTTIALTVDWAMRNPLSRTGRFLNAPTVSFVGVLSYSLYLWQQIFLNRNCVNLPCTFPMNLLFASTIAILSFVCVEAPFLRLRTRWEERLFGGTKSATASGNQPVLADAPNPIEPTQFS